MIFYIDEGIEEVFVLCFFGLICNLSDFSYIDGCFSGVWLIKMDYCGCGKFDWVEDFIIYFVLCEV